MMMRRVRRSRLSNVMQARLGPQAPSVEGQPCVLGTLKARLGPSTSISMPERPSQPLRQQQARALATRAPPGSISRRLHHMLSIPLDPHIINYEPSTGFIVPKFTTYDETSDPFDHIMHLRQLMALDIGNDALLCKVFPTSLHGQDLSWFHHLP